MVPNKVFIFVLVLLWSKGGTCQETYDIPVTFNPLVQSSVEIGPTARFFYNTDQKFFSQVTVIDAAINTGSTVKETIKKAIDVVFLTVASSHVSGSITTSDLRYTKKSKWSYTLQVQDILEASNGGITKLKNATVIYKIQESAMKVLEKRFGLKVHDIVTKLGLKNTMDLYSVDENGWIDVVNVITDHVINSRTEMLNLTSCYLGEMINKTVAEMQAFTLDEVDLFLYNITILKNKLPSYRDAVLSTLFHSFNMTASQLASMSSIDTATVNTMMLKNVLQLLTTSILEQLHVNHDQITESNPIFDPNMLLSCSDKWEIFRVTAILTSFNNSAKDMSITRQTLESLIEMAITDIEMFTINEMMHVLTTLIEPLKKDKKLVEESTLSAAQRKYNSKKLDTKQDNAFAAIKSFTNFTRRHLIVLYGWTSQDYKFAALFSLDDINNTCNIDIYEHPMLALAKINVGNEDQSFPCKSFRVLREIWKKNSVKHLDEAFTPGVDFSVDSPISALLSLLTNASLSITYRVLNTTPEAHELLEKITLNNITAVTTYSSSALNRMSFQEIVMLVVHLNQNGSFDDIGKVVSPSHTTSLTPLLTPSLTVARTSARISQNASTLYPTNSTNVSTTLLTETVSYRNTTLLISKPSQVYSQAPLSPTFHLTVTLTPTPSVNESKPEIYSTTDIASNLPNTTRNTHYTDLPSGEAILTTIPNFVSPNLSPKTSNVAPSSSQYPRSDTPRLSSKPSTSTVKTNATSYAYKKMSYSTGRTTQPIVMPFSTSLKYFTNATTSQKNVKISKSIMSRPLGISFHETATVGSSNTVAKNVTKLETNSALSVVSRIITSGFPSSQNSTHFVATSTPHRTTSLTITFNSLQNASLPFSNSISTNLILTSDSIFSSVNQNKTQEYSKSSSTDPSQKSQMHAVYTNITPSELRPAHKQTSVLPEASSRKPPSSQSSNRTNHMTTKASSYAANQLNIQSTSIITAHLTTIIPVVTLTPSSFHLKTNSASLQFNDTDNMPVTTWSDPTTVTEGSSSTSTIIASSTEDKDMSTSVTRFNRSFSLVSLVIQTKGAKTTPFSSIRVSSSLVNSMSAMKTTAIAIPPNALQSSIKKSVTATSSAISSTATGEYLQISSSHPQSTTLSTLSTTSLLVLPSPTSKTINATRSVQPNITKSETITSSVQIPVVTCQPACNAEKICVSNSGIPKCTAVQNLQGKFRITKGASFSQDLMDKTSNAYKNLAFKVEELMNSVYRKSRYSNDYITSRVINFTQGSVVVFYKLAFDPGVTLSGNTLQDIVNVFKEQKDNVLGNQFEIDNASIIIQDYDECSSGIATKCFKTEMCNNTLGSYSCICPVGTTGDGTSCQAVNESASNDNGDDVPWIIYVVIAIMVVLIVFLIVVIIHCEKRHKKKKYRPQVLDFHNGGINMYPRSTSYLAPTPESEADVTDGLGIVNRHGPPPNMVTFNPTPDEKKEIDLQHGKPGVFQYRF